MPRTLMPTPEEGDPPDRRATPAKANPDLEDQALLDFLRGDYAPGATINGAGRSAPTDGPVSDDGVLSYLPVASSCFAVVQYDPTTARLVRRVIGMFGDVQDAERYGMENGYRLYDVVPATAVIARPPTSS
jgi:hypothetical protein